MRYTFKQIFAARYDPDRDSARKLAERFVPVNIVTKTLSPYTAFIFLNLGISADIVTFLSLTAILAGAFLFIFGSAVGGIAAIFFFGVLDSTDGDVARISGRTSYGGALDSLGADFFYTCIPSSVGFFLFSKGITLGPVPPYGVFAIAVGASLLFLLYRIINMKRLMFLMGHHERDSAATADSLAAGRGEAAGFFSRCAKIYRHVLIKDNFFSEPGLILWFSIFVLLEQWVLLAGYLAVLLAYNFGFFVSNFIKMYLTFLKIEREKAEN